MKGSPMLQIACSMLLVWRLLVPIRLAAEESVGFIWHYPFTDRGTSQVVATGVTSMTSRAAWASIEPIPDYFTFDTVQKQIDVARKGRFHLNLILECNPFCAPQWLRARVASAHQNGAGPDGRPASIPSAQSSVYWDRLQIFLTKLARFLAEHDSEHTVEAVHPGIEWWFPPEYRYGTPDLTAFRRWLSARYVSLTDLNSRWKSSYRSFEEVSPPRQLYAGLFDRKQIGITSPQLVRPWPYDLQAASRDWYDFWVQESAATIDRIGAMYHSLDPSRFTISFQTYAWAIAGEWDYLGWAAFLPDVVASTAPHLDALGPQVPISWGDPYQVTIVMDLMRKYRRPLHAVDLLDFTQGQAAGLDVMVCGTHAAISHGAAAISYCSWAGAGDYSLYGDWSVSDISALIAQARGGLALSASYTPCPDGAMLAPFTYPDSLNNPASFAGFYRLLRSLHFSVDILTPRDLESAAVDPGNYDWVLVPDAHDLSGAVVASLSHARKLVITDSLPGLRLEPAVIPDFGASLVTDLRRDTEAGDGPPMLDFREEDPAKREQLAARLASALAEAGIHARFSGLPAEVDCTLMRSATGRLLYLVNRAGQATVPAVTVGVTGMTARSAVAYADLAEAPCVLTVGGDSVQLRLPSFKYSCIVRMETAGQ